MIIDIWSDIACPWCYLGLRRLDKARENLGLIDTTEIRLHSFELDPARPTSTTERLDELIKAKYSIDDERIAKLHQHLCELGADVDITFHFESVIPTNTFDAHRLLHFARTYNCESTLHSRIFRAYFEEGANIADHTVLLLLAEEVGIDPALTSSVLASSRYSDEVHQDEREANIRGIRGVPFFDFDQRTHLSGAHEIERFEEILKELTQIQPSS